MNGVDKSDTQLDVYLNDEELMRYSRQILLDNWDIDAQQKIKSSTVVIIGAGGLGCPVSETLARAGVGEIHLIDHDVIEASNLQRQTLFFREDIGEYKAEVACRVLNHINKFIEVSYSANKIVPENAENELAQPFKNKQNTLLLDCTDNFAIRDLINKVSVRFGIPLLSASAIGMTGQLALFEPAKNTGCYHCVFGAAIDSQDNDADNRNCSNSGVLASTTTVIGNLQANAALQYLGLNNNPLQGELLIWNGHQMTQHKLRYKQDRHCPVCAT